ncbi:MAG: molybdopterin-dependent oxidoreductase, partial [Firmicutes bacterium]|nr:molybdopterin-dependent oxidoreductase [Bacillota bacterium]
PFPWKKRGVGVAIALQGTGLGVGIPDYGAAIVELTEEGQFIVRIGSPEIGQGNMTAYAITAAEALGCDLALIKVVTGDTRNSPDSGTSTASRSAYTGGNAILDAVAKLKPKLLAVAGEMLGVDRAGLRLAGNRIVSPQGRGITLAELGRYLREKGLEAGARGNFVWPTADVQIPGAEGLPHLVYTYVTQMALVEVDTLTGKVELREAATALDAGRVLNRQGLEGQAEGGMVMGAGYALMEDIIIEKGYFKTMNLSTYIIPTSLDLPERHQVELVEVLEESGPYGAKGAGEAVMVPISPAITSAIHDAVGVRLKEMPAAAERVYQGLRGEEHGQ